MVSLSAQDSEGVQEYKEKQKKRQTTGVTLRAKELGSGQSNPKDVSRIQWQHGISYSTNPINGEGGNQARKREGTDIGRWVRATNTRRTAGLARGLP